MSRSILASARGARGCRTVGSILFAALLALPLGAQHPLRPGGTYDPAVPTPRSVLGYDIGDRFTPHHLLMRYVERLATTSRRIHVDTVARTFEGREMLTVILTSEANQQRPQAASSRR